MAYTYLQDLAEREAAKAKKAFDDQSARGWLAIVAAYGVPASDANYGMVRDYCHPQPITLQAFEVMLENPKVRTWLHDLHNDVQSITKEILRLLKNNGSHTKHSLHVEAVKLETKSLPELRERLAQIRESQRLARLSSAEVQRQLANRRALHVREREIPAEYDRAVILALPSERVKGLIRRYGVEKVNARLRGE